VYLGTWGTHSNTFMLKGRHMQAYAVVGQAGLGEHILTHSLEACMKEGRRASAAYDSIRQHTTAYACLPTAYACICLPYNSIRQHTPAIRQRTPAFLSQAYAGVCWRACAVYASIRQHTSAYVSIRQHTPAYVGIRRHTSAYVSIRQHTSAYATCLRHI
jgi:hypothetical protein